MRSLMKSVQKYRALPLGYSKDRIPGKGGPGRGNGNVNRNEGLKGQRKALEVKCIRKYTKHEEILTSVKYCGKLKVPLALNV